LWGSECYGTDIHSNCDPGGYLQFAENPASGAIITATLSAATISDVLSGACSGTAISGSDYNADSATITCYLQDQLLVL
jgi:hypothetical protein